MTRRASPRGGPARGSPTVVIVGATVAGLTAAQRLAERGFRVTVLRAPGTASLPEDLNGLAWSRPPRIQAFDRGGAAYRGSRPLPPATLAPPLLGHFRHLRSLLADIPATRAPPAAQLGPDARPRRTETSAPSVLSATVSRDWVPRRAEDEPWVVFGCARPETAEEFIEGAKHFLTAGYTIPDGQTFLARVLRFLTSSDQRRAAECEDVTMLDYLRGASLTSAPRFNYAPRFSSELHGLPELSLGIRPSRDEARVALGWYAQWLASVTTAPQDGSFEFTTGIGAGWARPWLLHLRTLKVRILQGTLHRLQVVPGGTAPGSVRKNGVTKTAPSSENRKAATVRAVLASGCDPAARALVRQARYLIVATDPAAAARACATLPAIGVPGALRGFTAAEPAGRARWHRPGEVHLFLPVVMNFSGPLVVVGSPWQLVGRLQHVFKPRPPTVARDGFGCVLAVEIQAGDVPSPTTKKSAAACDDRELAQEVWLQLAPALTARHRRKPPVWFMVASRPDSRQAGDNYGENNGDGDGDNDRTRAPRLHVLPGDWTRRPGPDPRPAPAGEQSPATQTAPPLWAPPAGGAAWLHWNRLLFAGDYLKTLTRIPGPEAACESALHAVNTLLAHATDEQLLAAKQPCPVWDPECHEPPAFAALRTLDAWSCQQRLPHIFEITGLDGWLGVASWLSHLSPATESFLKSVLDLGRSFARAPGATAAAGSEKTTSFQERGLDVLRRMREALENRMRPPP